MTGSPSERLLAELRKSLRPLGRRVRRRALDEARDHLLSATEDEIARGASPAAAEKRAVERFGHPAVIAAPLRGAHPRRPSRLLPVTVGAAVIAGTFALPAGPVRDNLAPAPARAAPGPGLRSTQCLMSWNSERNAWWHAYAVKLGTTRAYVGAFSAGKLVNRRLVTTARGCTVKLWLARRPGRRQNAVYVHGLWQRRAAGYGAAWRSPHISSQRTTIRFANAHVRADGTLVGTALNGRLVALP
ncbi:MAG: hypothetical protein QOD65_2295 [Gaiellales bacterium]|jgi:hypothetical protein|nr:hypothetical protein [Gaiellales bacterium]